MTGFEVSPRANIAFLTGPSDLLVLIAAMAPDEPGQMSDWVIVLMGRGANVPAAMLDVCAVMAPGASIHRLDIDSAEARSDLLDKTGRRFARVAISHLLGAGEEALLAELRRDELILTENGIATHVLPHSRARRLGASGQPRFQPDAAILPLAALPGLGLPAYLRSGAPPRVITADPGAYRRLHARLQTAFGLQDVAGRIARSASCAIVAGTSLCRTGIVDAAAEAEAYATRLHVLMDAPSPPLVVWKPHPRLDLEIALPPGQLVVERRPVPIELLLPFHHADCTMHSTASSSLLLASLWHGVAPRVIPLDMATGRLPHVDAVRQLAGPTG